MERLTPRLIFHLTTQGKPAVFNGQLAKPTTEIYYRIKIVKCARSGGLKRGDGTMPSPPKHDRIT
jgi:hypothetical protein